MDVVLIARVVTFLFFLWVAHGVICHASLTARLLTALATDRTSWPGPITISINKQEAIARRRRFAPPPSLYPQYLPPVAGMALALGVTGVFVHLTMTLPLAASGQAIPWVVALAGTLLMYFSFSRRAGFYEAMLEWTLAELPRQALDTDEPSEDVAHAFMAIRKGVRRICTSTFLAGLSALFMWGVWHNPHVRVSEAAIARPATGPLTWEHVERAANEGAVTYVGFMGHAVYIVISMRRWLRVSRRKKGVHAL
jgi:hypothetical protein